MQLLSCITGKENMIKDIDLKRFCISHIQFKKDRFIFYFLQLDLEGDKLKWSEYFSTDRISEVVKFIIFEINWAKF